MNIFSLLSLFAFFIYVSLAVYILSIDTKNKVNRLFFGVSVIFAFWAFSYSFMYEKQPIENLWAWYKLSAIGWAVIPSLLIHFMFVFLGKVKFNRKWWFYLILYAPAIVFLYKVFDQTIIAKNFYYSKLGIIEVHNTDSIWYTLFILYYLVFFSAIPVNVYIWSKNKKTKMEKKQGNLIIYTGIITLVLAVISNFIFPVFGIEFPAIGQIIALVWFIGIWLAIIRYNLLKLTPELALDEFLSKVNDFIFFIDNYGEIIKINDNTLKQLGFTKSQVVGENILAFIYEKEFLDEMLENIETNKFFGEEADVNFIKVDKKKIPVRLGGYTIKNKAGEISGAIIIGHDISKDKALNIQIEDRRYAENYLEESKKLYKDIIDNLPEGIFETDKEGNIIFVSKPALKLFGYKREDIDDGLNISQMLVKEERERAMATFYSRRIGEEVRSVEYMAKRKDGTAFPILYFAKPVEDNNEIVGFRGFVIDNTERKKAREELTSLLDLNNLITGISTQIINASFDEITNRINQSLQAFKEYFDADLIAVFKIFDKEYFSMIYEFKNHMDSVFEKDTYYTLSSFQWFKKNIFNNKSVHTSPSQPLPEEAVQEANFITNHHLSSVIVLPIEYGGNIFGFWAIAFKEKTYKWNNKTIELLRMTGEILVGAHQRKQTMEALHRSEKKYKELADSLPEAIYELDLDGNVIYANQTAMKFWGYTQEELENRINISQILTKENVKRAKINLQKVLQGENIGYIEYDALRKDGSILPLRTFVECIYHQHQPVGFRGIAIDITQQKAIAEQLQKAKRDAELANQAKSVFLANMSHEIRTPLNAIIGFAKLLEKEDLGKKEKQYIQTISSSSDTLLALINDILDLSKIEAGKLEIKYKPLNISSILNEVAKMFSFKIAEKNIDIKVEVDPGLHFDVFLDETRIRQIILNLTSNAVKFTSEGDVKLIAKKKNSTKNSNLTDIYLVVEDTGIGIPQNQQKKIFDSFKQVKGQNQSKFGGTGLGLAITKKLVEIMGGTIQLDSIKGTGSKFTILIPDALIVKEEYKNIQANYLDNVFPVENTSSLVISNQNHVLDIFEELAQNEGGELMVTDYKIVNIEHYIKKKPGIIFLDISDSSLALDHLIGELSKMGPVKKIPVIIIVSSTQNINLELLKPKNIDGMIKMPFNKNEIQQTIFKYSSTKETTKKKKLEDETNGEMIEQLQEQLGKLDKPIVAKLAYRLEKDMLDEHKQIIHSPKINQIKDFSKKLIFMGRKFHVPVLEEYGNNILKMAKEFNIKKMKSTLKHYPAIVEKFIEIKKQKP